MHPLLTEWWTGLRRLVAGPRSLERLLVLTMGGTLLLAIAALALGAGGLLREQAAQQALSRVRLAGLAARDEIRRHGEDAVTSARLLAGRATLLRLLRQANLEQLPLFLRRFCDTAGLDSCAVVIAGQVLASAGAPAPWSNALEAAREQGEGFMMAGASASGGQLGALIEVPGFAGTAILVIRRFDERLARSLSEQVGVEVRLLPLSHWLEAVRRARDSVLANISHEFRTPLAAQLASVELILDGLDGMPRERLGELLSSLQRGTLRLTRLIDNLLESVRIESGQLGIRRQPVLLAQVVEDAESLIDGLLAQRRQRLSLDLPDDLPVVSGDAQRLTQVVTNLLANASKFGPEDSEIRVGAHFDAGEVRLWVEDEGPGASDLDGTSIFERFHRSADQEPEPRGLGLGLWIVKSIVERHGGRVAAARTEDGRTRFTVTLPAAVVQS